MSDVTFDGYVLAAVLTIVSIGSIYLAGRIAERRGRSFKNWGMDCRDFDRATGAAAAVPVA
ncbi:MAG: hypothetical protein E6G93_04110 [Alphaproteobacteria bacterium]|nr:MAG: hypothetical protein E6G93_04110 [Alphaproteobacteria bacterium]